MAEQPRKLTGTEKAAVFLRSIGEEDAAQVLKHMGPKEVQKIGQAMATLRLLSKRQGSALDPMTMCEKCWWVLWVKNVQVVC